MILEFAGLPGSGKTTLSSALRTNLTTLPWPILSRQEALITCIKRRDDGKIKNMIKQLPTRFWWRFMGTEYDLSEFIDLSARHLEFISFMTNSLSNSTIDRSLTESIWRTIVRSFIEIQLVTTYMHNSEIVLMDEAFSQRCFTLFGYMEKTIPEEQLSLYAKMAPISNYIFWIATPPQTCINRLRERYKDKPCPYELDSEELLESFHSGHMILKQLGGILKSKGRQVYKINGDLDVTESIETIQKAVQGIGDMYA